LGWVSADMHEATVRFPVTCPICGAEALTSFTISEVAFAVVSSRRIKLHAICHDGTWDASDIEMQQIREYLGSVWLNTHAGAN
jgi:hypothetical protein